MKNTNESGRSMVEMLGVLAIIGVLSIGGIAGYTLAMNRYRANELLNAAALVAITATSSRGGAGDAANLANLGGLEALTLPAITIDNDIHSTDAGIVTIKVNKAYSKVGDLVRTLSGDRVVGDKNAKCSDSADCTIQINMSKSVKTSS
ncbi:MAG: type II secretion system protein [Alphaproteobacteria bacterium]|nr:type II secretion system protein [Alphaproteobacteria bacterium]